MSGSDPGHYDEFSLFHENAREVVVANRTSFVFNVFMFWGCLNEISGVTCH